MRTRRFELSGTGEGMPCSEALPDESDSPARGAVIVLQEAFGVNPHIEEVTRRLAGAGYHAVAPHLFHRTGSPTIAYDDVRAVLPHLQALSDEMILEDVQSVVSYLQESGWAAEQVGVVGFCMGGRASFLVAGSLALGAAAGFYGAAIVNGRSPAMGSLLGLVPTMSTPWLGLFGDADRSIPVEDVERLRDELLAHAAVDWDIVRYPGAEHGFHCDARPSYLAVAAIDGWTRTLAWFGEHLAQPG